jgi:hypothetical protein
MERQRRRDGFAFDEAVHQCGAQAGRQHDYSTFGLQPEVDSVFAVSLFRPNLQLGFVFDTWAWPPNAFASAHIRQPIQLNLAFGNAMPTGRFLALNLIAEPHAGRIISWRL